MATSDLRSAGNTLGATSTSSSPNALQTTQTSKMGHSVSTTSKPEAANPAGTLYSELLKSRKYGGKKLDYIPADALDRLITVESVLASTHGSLSSLCPHADAEMIVKRAKRTFAILILSRCAHIVYNLVVVEKMTDRHLPLSEHPDSAAAMMALGPEGPQIFKALGTPDNVETFTTWQNLALAPIFKGSIQPMVLRDNQPLPFWPRERIGMQGGYSFVYKTGLHPAHYLGDTGTFQTLPAAGFLDVAIKRFNRKCDFIHEYDNLTKTTALENPHLIKHMAAYQIRPDDCPEGDSTYHIIFPWADGGHLQDLWKEYSKAPRTPKLVQWSLIQMLGLATAIKALHQGLSEKTNCRHGDLKPQNILHFKSSALGTPAKHDDEKSPEGLGTLVIGDLGISRIHNTATYERNKVTGTKATTLDYEPPEALNIVRCNSRGEAEEDPEGTTPDDQKEKPWSRKYDMWSLGCIFLEFAIWLSHDFQELENFAKRRGQRAFYTIEKSKNNGNDNPLSPTFQTSSTKVCPRVGEAMAALRGDEATGIVPNPLMKLVDFIENRLLVIEVEGRCDAEELVTALQKIANAA